jgi:hypothetical protein
VLFWHKAGPGDADQYLVFHTLQYWNAGLFGLAKQWTPLMCSGLSMAGEPQIPFMSLAMLIGYVMGPLWGVKLSLVIYLVLGWIGASLYAGLWLRLKLQRALAAALFIGNGFFFCRLGLGHFDFAPFLLLPLMLWALHQTVLWSRGHASPHERVRLLVATALAGAVIALAIDGSPVTIIHLMLWVGLYAVVLAFSARSTAPVAFFGCAFLLASLLDAGYLWPMLEAQATFPRHPADSFTSVLSLLWFAILPMRGKVLPANGNGHELSVFIGPVLAWCLWRARGSSGTQLPASMRAPLYVVSAVSIVLGMGSLKGLHVPTWLSPFDLVRPLPGFRSINVTGRFWGFLALPLSVGGAAALWDTVARMGSGWRLQLLLGSLLVFQLAFQAETLGSHWFRSADYRDASVFEDFDDGPESINYVAIGESRLQGEVLSPTVGVCDCYDMDDFVRAKTAPGPDLILQTQEQGAPAGLEPAIRADFVSWSRIRIQADCGPGQTLPACNPPPGAWMRIILKQAFHTDWQAPSGCETERTGSGNLVLACPTARLLEAPLELVFRNPLSELSARVSIRTWIAWMCLAPAALLVPSFAAFRARRGVAV